MSYGKNTPEFQRVKGSFAQLSSALAMSGGIDSVCDLLVGEGLINNDQKADANNTMIGARKRASDLASLLLSKVQQNTKNFQKLVGVLQQEPSIFGTVLEHMGVSGGGASGQAAAGSNSPGTETVRTQQPAATGPKAFSDDLSPSDLVDWLSQQFQAKNLTLDPSLGQKMIADDINGEAFMNLEEKDLVEMGFTKGQRMKILKIIDTVKEGNDPSQKSVYVPAQEETKAIDSSDKPDFSELKEVTNGFLDLIEWDDGTGKIKLSIYSQTAGHWKTIARKLGLEDTTPGFTSSTAKHHRDIDRECVIEVFGKWLENASGLPYASRFSKSWEGLHTLLVESELGEVAKKLYRALNVPNCSVRK